MFSINALSWVPEILIYGAIGEGWSEETIAAKQLIEELQAIEATEIVVRINSVGGSVPDALAIYNALRRHPARITVAIDGLAASSASMIAMAGDHVEMAENAMLMIHAPWAVVTGNAEGLRECAEVLDRWAALMVTNYARKTGKGSEHAKGLLDGKDHYYTAAEAQVEGFVDEVVEPMAIAAYGRIPMEVAAQFIDPNKFTTQQLEEFTMPGQQTAPQNDPPAPQPNAAAEREQRRQQEIRTSFQPFAADTEVAALMGQCLADPGVTASTANARLLAKLGQSGEPVAGDFIAREHPNTSGADRFREDATAALLARAGLADKETRAKAAKTNFRSFKLLDFARASLERSGVSHGHMDPMRVVGAAFTQSTSDFPILLENTMHKTLLDAYQTAPDAWSRFCHIGSVTDFRAHGRYRTGSIGNYTAVNENGEFEYKTLPDGEKSSITVTTKGNIINLSRQMIVNDDLNAFLGVAADLGRAGRRTVEAAVFSVLAENDGLGPNMSDGNPLFDASHNNIGTGALLSVESIEADRVLLGSQMDISGNDFLYLRPDVLLLPMSLGGQARVINSAEYDPDALNRLNKPNSVRGLFNDVVDTPRLSGTRRYMFANPTQGPVIEVAFLNGESEPYIEMQTGFTVDGTAYKARLDFGVAAIDYRGAVTNAGTA
ncbi:MAG: ClpP-like prohead protease/major capsid protein fusion protein [Pseudomonadota bacterium]